MSRQLQDIFKGVDKDLPSLYNAGWNPVCCHFVFWIVR